MDLNTNPLTNTNPTPGAAPGVPPIAPLPQGTSQPMVGGAAAPTVGSFGSQVVDVSQTPGATGVSDVNAAVSVPSGIDVSSNAGVAPIAGGGGMTVPAEMDANNGSSILEGVGTGLTSPLDALGAASVSSAVASESTVPLDSMGGGMQDKVTGAVPNIGMEEATTASVPPIGRPTNIDGVNSIRAPEDFSDGNNKIPGPAMVNPFLGANDRQTPSVSFTDLAVEPEKSPEELAAIQGQNSQKKKTNKTILIILSVLAFLVAAALAVVLVMEVMGIGPFASNDGGSSQVSEQSDSSDDNNSSESSGNNSSSNNNESGDNDGGDDSSGGNNGDSGNSGSSNEGSEAGSLQVSSGDILCSGTSTTYGDGSHVNMVITIVDNKITEIKAETTAVDQSGNEQNFSMTMPIDQLTGSDGVSMEQNEYFESDGTLKVSAQELAEYLETSMSGSGWTGTCVVK